MPVSYALAPAHGLAAVALVGPVRGPDLVAVVQALHADPRWRPDFDTVWDGLSLTDLLLDLREVEAVADLRFGPDPAGRTAAAPSVVPTGRGAFVVRREIDEEVARLFVAMARRHGREGLVVRSVPEALAVLGKGAVAWGALEWTPVPGPSEGT